MKTSSKVITTIVAIFAIAAAALALQVWGGRLGGGQSVSATEMEALVATLSPQEQAQLRRNEEQRKELAKQIRQILALGQEAKQQGYDRKDPNLAGEFELQKLVALAREYQRRMQTKNQAANPTDEEISAYEKAHPNAFADFLKSNPRYQQIQGPQAEEMKKSFHQLMVLVDKAKAEKLDQDPGYQVRLRVEQANMLADPYVKELREKITVSDQEFQQYYETHKQEFEQVRARHVLVSTRPEPNEKGEAKPVDREAARKKAEGLLRQAREGKDFATLARENTDEPQGKETGGDLGFFGKGKMVPVFEQAAFAMQPGQISDVVESPFGFHVIKLEERRLAPAEEMKEEIEAKLKQEKFKQQLDSIVARSGIQVDENFKVPEPAGGVQQLPGGLPPGHP